jgi:hypothetical protein
VINAQRAVDMRTLVSPAQIMLNDTKYFNGIHTITINNLEAVPVTYTLSNMNARAVTTYNNVRLERTISERRAQANGGWTIHRARLTMFSSRPLPTRSISLRRRSPLARTASRSRPEERSKSRPSSVSRE